MASQWPPSGSHPVAFEPAITSTEAAREAFALVRDAVIENAFDEYRDAMLMVVDDDEVVGRYVRCAPLVGRLVGSELDVATPGTRGLGRNSDAIPRLGGYFRKGVANPDVGEHLGALAERVVAAGYAAAAALYSGWSTGSPPLVDRELEDTYALWVPRAYAGMRGPPVGGGYETSARELLFGWVGEVTELFYREGKKTLAGPLALRKRLALSKIANFYAGAGAALYEVNTDLVERGALS